MPQRRSALLKAYQTGTFGATPEDGPGIQLAERRGLAIIHLAGPGEDEAFRAAVKGCLGCAAPLIPNATATSGDRRLLWLAPTRWLVVSTGDGPADLLSGLTAALVGLPAAVTDVSSGRTVIRIMGRDSRNLLAKAAPWTFIALASSSAAAPKVSSAASTCFSTPPAPGRPSISIVPAASRFRCGNG